WLARLNKFQTHAALFAPRPQRSPTKLRPVIEHDRFWQPAFAGDLIQHPPHTQSTQRGIGFNRRALPRAIIYHSQHANHSSRAYTITDEIDRPTLVRPGRSRATHRTRPANPPPLPDPHRQSFLAIQPVHPLVVGRDPFPHQHCRESAISEPHALVSQFLQTRSQPCIPLLPVRSIAMRRPSQSQQPARVTFAHL